MKVRKQKNKRGSQGQSLVETALMIPVLLMLILNAVNFGYFLLVTLNLTSATRNGIEYAIQGSSTPRNSSLPAPGSLSGTPAQTVNAVISQELGGLRGGALAVQVCTLNLGSAGSPARTNCATAGSVPKDLPPPDADPEAATYPGYALNRVDIWYTFQPLVPATPFSLAVLSFPSCTSSGGTTTCIFSRHAEMRAMGS
jgi:hypothetical protein